MKKFFPFPFTALQDGAAIFSRDAEEQRLGNRKSELSAIFYFCSRGRAEKFNRSRGESFSVLKYIAKKAETFKITTDLVRMVRR